jgi:glycosyltransferase involved in cell wall biosynthesis
MERVVVVHPDVNFGGGAEAVAAHTVDALSRLHDVTLVTWSQPDRAQLDSLFGTELASAPFRVVAASTSVRAPNTVSRHLLFRHVVGSRVARSTLAGQHLVIGTHGELTTQLPTIQYVHHPIYSSRVPPEILTGVRQGLAERLTRMAARAAARALVGGSRAAFGRSTTLTNSLFMAEWIERAWGICARVLWPPIPLAARPRITWETRESGVVCVGRLIPGKRILEIIRAVAEARRLGADLHLHVVGEGAGAYAAAVRAACRRDTGATYEGVLSLPDVTELLSGHRFGVHAARYEHFGISLAQMVRAGCITFAANGGAPAQTLASTPYLLYDDFEQLASRLKTISCDRALQAQLRIDLAPIREAFERHRFGQEMASVVRERLERHEPPAISTSA